MGSLSGEDFKRRRDALDLSQAAIAARLELHVMTISKWERGVNPIPDWAALALAGLEAEHRPKRRNRRAGDPPAAEGE